MHIETERKFLVLDRSFENEASSKMRISQGYIAHENGKTVRVRICDEKAFLTIKGPSANGISRMEWEIEIPADDAKELLCLCNEGLIEKTRYIIPEGSGLKFEVDEFYGDNDGLTVAEIELKDENDSFQRPQWLGEEVTGDKRYYNSHLLKYPYKDWE